MARPKKIKKDEVGAVVPHKEVEKGEELLLGSDGKEKKGDGIKLFEQGHKTSEPETILIPKSEWEQVQKTLEMLKSVADKGRVYNYEAGQKTDKKPKKVKLSKYDGGYIIAWETQKDELVKHPVTGATVGENQQIEVKILMPNGDTVSKVFNSYVQFSNARYDSRDECEVIGTSENYTGQIKWTLALPDGRHIELSPNFVN